MKYEKQHPVNLHNSHYDSWSRMTTTATRYSNKRALIRSLSNAETNMQILHTINIDSTKDGFIRVRPDDGNPSCKINKDGSFHDYGSGEHYGDIVSLLFDGYKAFESLPETMEWLCEELNIDGEASDE